MPTPHIDDLDGELERLFARATAHIEPPRDLAANVHHRLAQRPSNQFVRTRRPFAIGATLSAAAIVALLAGVLFALGRGGAPQGGTGAHGRTSTPAAFKVTSVDLAVTPISLAGMACGSKATFVYTATFHIPANTAGGEIQFTYTAHSGQMEASAPGSLQVAPGQTNATMNWTDSGSLPPDNTWPPPVQVMVIAPNHATSNTARPSGTCGASGSVPFEVTNVGVSVSPVSVSGMSCGTAVIVTYTATFYLPARNPGGVIQFQYTINNGRGSTPATLSIPPGQTTATYQFQWAGQLPADHTYPAQGGVIVSSPNTISSPLVGPSGTCS